MSALDTTPPLMQTSFFGQLLNKKNISKTSLNVSRKCKRENQGRNYKTRIGGWGKRILGGQQIMLGD